MYIIQIMYVGSVYSFYQSIAIALEKCNGTLFLINTHSLLRPRTLFLLKDLVQHGSITVVRKSFTCSVPTNSILGIIYWRHFADHFMVTST